ncbi:phytanoyl-CoA dioxygenase family protein [Paraburkholderia hospita]|uniref:phytanoyl-CoA dioxygenase family protein n=1 Tax=Paraburkholderia hospita TaxID=169430 RepID=UPI000B34248C|nr:phytanoyl-CoA dioxygenase family protein [Paraburkholderia hospita]OUL88678.1 hypothetical protein CA601_18095 [Paraburkholderia hospita]
MNANDDRPQNGYGILRRNQANTTHEIAAEQVRDLGYAVIDSGYTTSQMQEFSAGFERTRQAYVSTHGLEALASLDELNTIRAPLTHGDPVFLKLAMNENLHSVLNLLILGKYIINQQNGIINPPQQEYNQGIWHRDLPYQHFTSSRPLAINALFCVDDFTLDNGATFILPASHKSEAFPSETYIRKNAIQVEAKAGAFILLDCMIFHRGGYNKTQLERRAVNHVYNIPYFKQQINIPANMSSVTLLPEQQSILGFGDVERLSVDDYLSKRKR